MINKPEKHLDYENKDIIAAESFQLIDFYKKNLQIIDSRDYDLYVKGAIDQAINIPKEKLLEAPERFLDQSKIYLIYGKDLSDDELREFRKHCRVLYYMTSDFSQWQVAALKYFETKIK